MKGLTNEQVKMSREKYGSNKLPEPKLKKWYEFAIENIFGDKTLMLLLALSAYEIFAAVFGLASFSEPIMVILVISLCTYIGVKMALGIQKSTQELRAKTSTRYCDVIRDGQVQTINKDNLVVGDVVCIGTGQEIYADGYIIEGKISVSNAAINGESKECQKIPINGYVYKKSTSTDDFTNQNSLFAGTTILSGEGKMIVGEVGVNTINGDTLVKMQTLEPPKTALQIAIDKLCDTISRYGTIAAVVTFIALMVTDIAYIGFREYINGGVLEVIQKIAQNISVALTIIVAAVPEGLPLSKLICSVRIPNPLHTDMMQSIANLAVIASTSVVNNFDTGENIRIPYSTINVTVLIVIRFFAPRINNPEPFLIGFSVIYSTFGGSPPNDNELSESMIILIIRI